MHVRKKKRVERYPTLISTPQTKLQTNASKTDVGVTCGEGRVRADCLEKLIAASANFQKEEFCSWIIKNRPSLAKKSDRFGTSFCQIWPQSSVLKFFNRLSPPCMFAATQPKSASVECRRRSSAGVVNSFSGQCAFERI